MQFEPHSWFLLLVLCSQWLTSSSLHAEAWPVTRHWDTAEETRYSEWIAQLSKNASPNANQLLHDQAANSLFDPADASLTFRADCGDLPYLLRSYYAYKRSLPMILNSVDGGNYSPTPNRTTSQTDNLTFIGTPAEFFLQLPEIVNTANLRIDSDDPRSAFYFIKISRQHLRPGSVFYDPNGHAAIVSEIFPDGSIRLIDAHPDQSITRISFGEKLNWRSASHSGGFLAFRPIQFEHGKIFYDENPENLPGFSLEQHNLGSHYHLQVKLRLATERLDPLLALENYIRNDTFQEALDRVAAVERGWAIGQTRPIPIPSNIYNTTGDWEDFATPGRDIRLRISFLSIPKQIDSYVELANSQPDLLIPSARDSERLYEELTTVRRDLFDSLKISYTNSDGKQIPLTLNDIAGRLFDLSFDPNHPPELRWGATGSERSTARRDQTRFYANYEEQQPWRNQLERRTGEMSPTDDDNPRTPPTNDLETSTKKLPPEEQKSRRVLFPRLRKRN